MPVRRRPPLPYPEPFAPRAVPPPPRTPPRWTIHILDLLALIAAGGSLVCLAWLLALVFSRY